MTAFEIHAPRGSRWARIGSSDLRLAAEAIARAKASSGVSVRVVDTTTGEVLLELDAAEVVA